MKLTSITLLASIASATAFVPNQQQPSTTATTSLLASRRDVFGAAAVAFGMAILPLAASADARPTYLTEPSDDFKESEAKAMIFKRQQLAIKKEFVALLERLSGEGDDSDALTKDLNDLQNLIAKTGGLPLGIKKDEMVKIIRSKKAKGFWPTPVEIA